VEKLRHQIAVIMRNHYGEQVFFYKVKIHILPLFNCRWRLTYFHTLFSVLMYELYQFSMKSCLRNPLLQMVTHLLIVIFFVSLQSVREMWVPSGEGRRLWEYAWMQHGIWWHWVVVSGTGGLSTSGISWILWTFLSCLICQFENRTLFWEYLIAAHTL
jgi:hypothetical protein